MKFANFIGSQVFANQLIMQRILNQIKLKISRREYKYAKHIDDKFNEYALDGILFDYDDVLNAVKTCYHIETLDNDERGRRYVIIGSSIEGIDIEVTCKIIDDIVFFITIYLPYE